MRPTDYCTDKPPSKLLGFTLLKSEHIPEGTVFGSRKAYYAAPLTYWSLTHEGRYPWLSRYNRGIIEMERDRRRYGQAA